MSINKQALLRYRIIDDCFHKGPKFEWTNDELLNHVNKELRKENFASIAMRTLQVDFEYLIKEKSAPITEKRDGYTRYKCYADRTFTIQNSPLSEKDKQVLQEAAILLRAFEGLPHFEAMNETLAQLQCWTDDKAATLILFEENEYAGRKYLKPLYEAVQQRKEILVDYEPFSGSFERRSLQPYVLKEFRNRWYVVGWEKAHQRITSAALDRIKNIETLSTSFHKMEDNFDAQTYFKDVIGVTVYKEALKEKIVFKVHKNSAKYLETKKLHHSQCRMYQDGDWTHFELQVKINYELKAELLRFGAALEVLKPMSLRAEFKQIFEDLNRSYQE